MKIIPFLLLSFLPLMASGHALDERAARAFDAREWASAEAMYLVISDAEPEAVRPYARIIVSNVMRGDSTATLPAVERALNAHVAIDSLLDEIRNQALEANAGDIYPQELNRIAAGLPYLRRPIDARLLDYALFRSDPDGIIRYATALLKGLPNSTLYLNKLAYGYMLRGDMEQAAATWRRVLEIDPDNTEARLYLENI